MKLLDLSSLYIDSNGCNKVHKEAVLNSPESNCNKSFSFTHLSPNIVPKDSMIIGNIFVTQEEGRGSQSFKNNTNGENQRQQKSMTAIKTKSTYNGSSVTTKTNYQDAHQTSVDVPASVKSVPSSPVNVHSNGTKNGGTAAVNTKTPSTFTTFPKTTLSLDTTRNSPLTAVQSIPSLSQQTSLSDSSCSYRSSSTDSLPGAEGPGEGHVRSLSPQSPPAMGSPRSAPTSPNGQTDSEPIYAESTKKKRRTQVNGLQSNPESPNRTKNLSCSEPELSAESHRATITVMAAHTEENNRTFYLSSPDSAVSTQCHFSPTAHKDPSSPAFRWPSPSRSAPSLTTDAILTSTLHPKPQSSPPIPPKRNTRSPKLGTSSLTTSMSSPVPLPELPRLGASSLTQSISSPVPLPELPMLFLVSAAQGHFKVHTEHHGLSTDRWQKPNHHSSGWNCRIEEEEEEDERERKEDEAKSANPGTTSWVAGMVNGAAVWKEAKDNKAPSSLSPMTEPGTAPPTARNNGACQGETEGIRAKEGGKQNGIMPAKQPLHGGTSELLTPGKGTGPNPPPPPPKKLHR